MKIFFLLLLATMLAVDAEDQPELIISKTTLEMAKISMRFASLVYDKQKSENYAEKKENRKFYFSDKDAVLTTRDSNYCIAAFRGTTPIDTPNSLSDWINLVKDWKDNLDIFKTPVFKKDFDNKCTTTKGFKNAFSFGWWKVISDVKECMAKCANCEAITTGHSQGGALAQIGALYLKRYFDIEPYVFLFGSPPAVHKKCKKYLSSYRWYHFIQAIPHEDGLQYDVVPVVSGQLLRQLFLHGHEIVISRDSPLLHGYHYVGMDLTRWERNDRYPKRGSISGPISSVAHSKSTYKKSLTKLYDSVSGDYLHISGFDDQYRCMYGVECKSQICQDPTPKTCSPTPSNPPSGIISVAPTTNEPTIAPVRSPSAQDILEDIKASGACDKTSDWSSFRTLLVLVGDGDATSWPNVYGYVVSNNGPRPCPYGLPNNSPCWFGRYHIRTLVGSVPIPKIQRSGDTDFSEMRFTYGRRVADENGVSVVCFESEFGSSFRIESHPGLDFAGSNETVSLRY